ncbi:hypothetical protein PRNP1_001310 [Phytophthora ramorum]
MASSDGMQDYLINWNAGPLGVVLRPDLGADMPPVVAQLLPQPSVLKMAGVREGDLLISVNGKKTTRLGYEKVVRLLFKERLPMVLHFRSPLQELQRGVAAPIAEEPASKRGRSRTSSSAQQPKSRQRGRSDVDAQARAQLIEQKRNPSEQNFSIDSDVSSKSRKKKSKHKSKHKDKAEAEERRLRKQFSVVWERGSLGISFRAYNTKVNVPCVDFISASRGQGRGMDRVCVNDVLIAINGEKTKALGVEKVLRWLHVIEKPVVLRFHASSNRVVNPAGGLLPHLADEERDSSARPRRPTKPLPQPEFEPAPRPPRRNNSVDLQTPQRAEQGYSDEREYELQPAVARTEGRRFSRDSSTHFEQQPIDEYEPQYQFAASNIEVKERRYSNNSMNAYARGRELTNEDGVAGDFRREPMDEAPQFDLRIDAHIIPHRRPTYDDTGRFNQPQQQAQLPPPRSRTSSDSRDDIRRQQQYAQEESKPAQRPVTIHASPARPRLASRDSQVSNSSHLSFDEATGVVARAAGKPKEECEFGGVPLLDIKEGTVQAKLMYIYAKACLAKEGNSDDELASKDPQPARTPGNPLGRKTHSKYLSYTILQDDHVASNHLSSQTNGNTSHADKLEEVDKQEELEIEEINHMDNSVELKNGGVFSHNLDASFAKMQKDISIQPPVVTPPLSSGGPSSLVSSDTAPAVMTPLAPADDFISLKDFVVKGGSLTTSSYNSTATPVISTDGGEVDKTEEQQEKEPAPIEKPDEVISAVNSEAAVKEVATEVNSEAGVEEVATEVNSEDGEEKIVTELNTKAAVQEMKSTEAMVGAEEHIESEHAIEEEQEEVEPIKMIEFGDDHDDDHDHMDENADDDAASIDSSNERDLAASVASLDDLLDLGNHNDDEHEEFDDDDEEEENENEESHSDEKEAMNTSLGMKLGQVQEEEAGETEEHEHHKAGEEQMEHEPHEEEDEFHDGALSNPLVNELFCTVHDVREVIKDKPALVVLVKKTMIEEIQEILQSLQMELQFERHSTMAIGSTASPLRDSQNGRDTEGKHCDRCGSTGELAELDVAGRHGQLYCQDCWELFFFSEDRESPVVRTSKTLAPSETSRLTADEDALDEALKYSFHDSTITREDIIHPWRYRQGSDSMSSSIRDSDASSITDRADEVWL